MPQSILLDPSIRDWVLLPLTGIVLLLSVLRHYLSLLLQSPPAVVLHSSVNKNIASYGKLLLSAGGHIPPSAFKERVAHMLENDLNKELEAPNPMEMMNDPNMMMSMMKGQFLNMGPNVGMMMLVSYFFSGFVVAKFPFPLSQRFRGMMQRGLDIDDLDCSYVTSLSMYFLIMSGCQGLLQLLLGQDVEMNDQMAMMQQQMQGGGAQAPVDYRSVFKQLSEEMQFMKDRQKWLYADAPEKLLKDWRAKKNSRKIRN
ncbi:hypothetical protein STCU_01592 [Strigomonas culicis]|uniref:ER membrane protein complex subunit 3 n=1 Tax=Strigomonas culicis TaxID=28005 RepID=S9TW83_9TRYP|nr:hypothetical protein STCU_08155 [Strigomonas culicis]EPY34422.1 hypothetical protein STCU_01592 [Strigomonas culicis]|eukprot:EPY22732.1 hypothetical protein STCU_08155 [Strigomonas culicis]